MPSLSNIQAMVLAMGRLRSTTGDGVPEVRTFIMDLIRYNYNAKNKVWFWVMHVSVVIL